MPPQPLLVCLGERCQGIGAACPLVGQQPAPVDRYRQLAQRGGCCVPAQAGRRVGEQSPRLVVMQDGRSVVIPQLVGPGVDDLPTQGVQRQDGHVVGAVAELAGYLAP